MSNKITITEGMRVEAGLTAEAYDTGVVHALDGATATIGWDSGVSTTCPVADLRPEGTDAPPSETDLEELRDEAAQAGDSEMVRLCDIALDGETHMGSSAYTKAWNAAWKAIRAAKAMA